MSDDELGPMEGRILRGVDALGRSAAEWLTAADLDARRELLSQAVTRIEVTKATQRGRKGLDADRVAIRWAS